jgi:hypothetical protein
MSIGWWKNKNKNNVGFYLLFFIWQNFPLGGKKIKIRLLCIY